jgi:hypothetical protein
MRRLLLRERREEQEEEQATMAMAEVVEEMASIAMALKVWGRLDNV